jgi:seryl-tRNA synthetase
MSEELNIDPSTSTDPNGNQKVVFDEAQTKRVSELITERLRREQEKTSRTLAEKESALSSLQEELRAAKEAVAKAKPGSDKSEASDELARLKAELEQVKGIKVEADNKASSLKKLLDEKDNEIKSAREEATNVRKDNAIRGAISKIGFVDPDDIVALTAKQIQWSAEYNKHVVVGDGGQVVLNSAFEPKSLDEHYRDYAEKKKHLVRTDFLFGTGSSENKRAGISSDGQYKVTDIFGPKSNAKLTTQLYREKPAEYQRLRAEAVKSGLLIP